MRVIIAILFFCAVACKSATQPQKPHEQVWTAVSDESFEFGKGKAYLQVFVNEKSDSFNLICKNDSSTYLDIILDQPPAEVKAQNIAGDSLPEIIIYDCLGCDLGRLRLFFFDRNKKQYAELKGTDSLLSEINNLDGANLIYNVACFNQGGCESTLLKVVDDSCISLAKMYVPYGDEPVRLSRNLSQSSNELIYKPNDLDTDSLIPFLWRNHFLKKSQQPRALKNKG